MISLKELLNEVKLNVKHEGNYFIEVKALEDLYGLIEGDYEDIVDEGWIIEVMRGSDNYYYIPIDPSPYRIHKKHCEFHAYSRPIEIKHIEWLSNKIDNENYRNLIPQDEI